MIEIPEQLKNEKFRFVPIKDRTKAPIGTQWQTTNNYLFYEKAFRDGAAYGVIGGFGNLYIIDFDDAQLQDNLLKQLPETFTVKTGGKGLFHLYYISETTPKSFKIVSNGKTLCDIQGQGKQVIGANSKHAETGRLYTVEKNIPIAKFDINKVRDLLKSYEQQDFSGANSTVADNINICKFHEDKKASMAIYKDTGTFYCFGCGAYGFLEVLNSKKKPKSKQTKHGTFYFYEKNDSFKYIKMLGLKEKEETPITNKDVELLKNPDLLNIIDKEFDKKIVGEYDTRKAIFLNGCGKWVINASIASYNLCINSNSGAGKDHVVKNVLKIFPEKDVVIRSRISPTVFTYWHNSKFEPEWNWDNKICLLSDISDGILNHEVFKLMVSDGTFSTVVINQQACDIEIKGKPVMFITTASASPNNEMLRRFPFAEMNETIEQTKAIKERQAEFAEQGTTIDYDAKITEALKKLKRVKVKIPFAKQLKDSFPDSHIIMRTHFNRLLDNIRASAALHQFQRETDDNGFFIATTQDYDYATIPLKVTTSNPFMIPLTKKQKMLLEVCKELNNFSVKEIETKTPFLVQSKLYDTLAKLQELGFLESYLYNERDNNGKIISKKPVRKYTYIEFSVGQIPLWKDIEDSCRKKGIEGVEGIEGIQGIEGNNQKTTNNNDSNKNNSLNSLNSQPRWDSKHDIENNSLQDLPQLIKDNDIGQGASFIILKKLINKQKFKDDDIYEELARLCKKAVIFSNKSDSWRVLE